MTEAVRDADGKVVIPAGAKAQVIIKSLTQGGKIKGQADLVLDLASVSIDGRQYALSTVDLEEKGRAGLGKNKRTAEFLGGGAAIGGIVGGLLGGGKGAAIGAGAGAGGGTRGSGDDERQHSRGSGNDPHLQARRAAESRRETPLVRLPDVRGGAASSRRARRSRRRG